jgi:hypothetical protein
LTAVRFLPTDAMQEATDGDRDGRSMVPVCGMIPSSDWRTVKMIDAESPEGMKVLIRQKDEEIARLRGRVRLTESTLDSLVEIQKALIDGRTADAAGLIMKAIIALRA